MSNNLSDLDLVAQAMGAAPVPPPPAPRASASTVPNDTDLPPLNGNVTANGSAPEEPAVPLDILQSLQTLSPSDRAAFQPLLQALALTSSGDGNDVDPANISEEELVDLLAQLDAADNVADNLEGKLDRLLESLKDVEGSIEVGAGAGEGGLDSTEEEKMEGEKVEAGSSEEKQGAVDALKFPAPTQMAGEAKEAFAKDSEEK